MITSFFDGRVRIRAAALQDPDTLERVKGLIAAQDGVREIVANPRTGSLLVHYDPDVISRETLTMAAGMLENELESETPKKRKQKAASSAECAPGTSDARRRRRQETALLGALYGVTVFGGFVNKQLHIASGALFTALIALHVYNRRKCL